MLKVLSKTTKEFIKKKTNIISKSQPRFKNKKHNVFTEEINKNNLSSNDDKKIQSVQSIETCAYRTQEDLTCKKEKIKCNETIIKND